MWYLLGKDTYVAVYEQLDQMMGLDQLGIKYGGMIFGAVSTTVVAGSLLAIIGHKVRLLARTPVHAHLLFVLTMLADLVGWPAALHEVP